MACASLLNVPCATRRSWVFFVYREMAGAELVTLYSTIICDVRGVVLYFVIRFAADWLLVCNRRPDWFSYSASFCALWRRPVCAVLLRCLAVSS